MSPQTTRAGVRRGGARSQPRHPLPPALPINDTSDPDYYNGFHAQAELFCDSSVRSTMRVSTLLDSVSSLGARRVSFPGLYPGRPATLIPKLQVVSCRNRYSSTHLRTNCAESRTSVLKSRNRKMSTAADHKPLKNPPKTPPAPRPSSRYDSCALLVLFFSIHNSRI